MQPLTQLLHPFALGGTNLPVPYHHTCARRPWLMLPNHQNPEGSSMMSDPQSYLTTRHCAHVLALASPVPYSRVALPSFL